MRVSRSRGGRVGGLSDRSENADAGAVVAGIDQGGKPVGGGFVQRPQDVCAGGGQVVHRSGFDVGCPQWQGADRAWMLPPWWWAFPEYRRSMGSPLTLMVFSAQRSVAMTVSSTPISGASRSIPIHVRRRRFEGIESQLPLLILLRSPQ